MNDDWRSGVLKFWFGLDEDQWFGGGADLGRDIARRFQELWEEKRSLPATSFLDDPLTALAGVILFDQFPRNMFRGHADQFSTDPLALQIARGAVDKGFDDQLEARERSFLYMPFMHSEDMDDQQRSMLLFTRLADDRQLSFAQKHRDVIAKYGRFPHRNAVLGRAPRAGEPVGDDPSW
ncbi:DUF924 domain-containing protein [Sphingomonas sabuli]|uniref:DUF924 domain-containing protein n=1 Tax=Sphingomonas sabuli TaxID=2764186 RepID=A0A7G9L0B0_9SPHN|nr:DUF924 family protein [Sphingomonas sabuli]QNM82059.1 DUF924 domain-containing protein [Sphingomonas sabuli]